MSPFKRTANQPLYHAVFILQDLGTDWHQEIPKRQAAYYFRPYKTILVRTVGMWLSYYVRRSRRDFPKSLSFQSSITSGRSRMNSKRIAEILKSILIYTSRCGRLFSGQYLMIDRDLAEISLETVWNAIRSQKFAQPGAPEKWQIILSRWMFPSMLSYNRKDGRGFDLKTELLKRNVDIRA
jgi:5-carboxymethyl-2-hydroxymuconate isomerase